MSAQGGSIVWTIDADSKKFDKELSAASSKAKGLGDDFDAVGSRLTGAFKVAGVAAVAALGLAVTGAAKASWDQVSAVQQATVGLKAYESNATKVDSVLKDLVSYARSDMGVLFNRKDLFQSAQSLKIMGDNTDDLVGHVKILSRSVGLGLSNWQDLNLIVGRVGSTGRLTGEDFDNLTKAGFRLDPALRNTNINFAELFRQLDKGIPSQALEGQAATIEGKMIRLQTAFRGVGDAILGVDSDTGKFIKGGLGSTLVNALDKITKYLSNPEFKQGVRETFNNIAQGVKAFLDVIKQVVKVLQPVTDFIKNNKQAWDVLKLAIVAIVGIITGIIILIGVGLVGAFALIMIAINAAIWVFTKIAEIIIWLGGVLSTAIVAFWTFATGVIEAVGKFVAGVIKGVQDVINWFMQLPGKILGVLSGAGSWLVDKGKDILRGLVSGIVSMAGALTEGVSSVSANIGKFFDGAAGWLWDTGKAIVMGLVNGIKSGAGAVADAAKDIAKGAVDAAKSVLQIKSPSKIFAGIGRSVSIGLAEGIGEASTQAISATKGMASSLSSAMDAQGTVAFDSSMAPSVIGGAQDGSTQQSNQYHIGTINISSEVDGERWLKKLTRNQEIIDNGLIPSRGAM